MRTTTTRLLYIPMILFVLLSLPSLQAQNEANDEPILADGHLQRQVISAKKKVQTLVFQNLIPNQNYLFMIPLGDPAMGNCYPDIRMLDPNAEVIKEDKLMHSVEFKANATFMDFELSYPCDWSPDNPPRHFISLQCLSCKKTKLKEYLKDVAILEVNGGIPAEELVKDVLIGGNCFDISGVTFSGQGGQIGTFSNGTTNIGFPTGVVMATGDVGVCPGPNDQDNASAGYGSNTADPDLSQMANGGTIWDMANIEFDFTPTDPVVLFEFVFASEEYCEYVNTQFNDVFGFFISGPGIAGPFGGAANIAVIPSTTTYVTINNINHVTNSGLYRHNTPAGLNNCEDGGIAGNLPPVPPAGGQATNELQFDGFTAKMVAVANVQPCGTYHIKLKVADVGDGIFDSAVFLKSGSFDAGGNASVDWVVNGDPDLDVVYEGCGVVKLVFERVGTNLAGSLPIQFTIGGTATPGSDYVPIPPVVVIPSGQKKLELTVVINVDNVLEGDETIVITLKNKCSCANPDVTLTIKDLIQVKAKADTTEICGPGVGTINVTGVDGAPPYKYVWSNGSTEESISPYVAVSTDFKVTVTDECGLKSVGTGRIIVNPLPKAQLVPPAPQLCPGQSSFININFTGEGPFTVVYSINGDVQPTLEDITVNPYKLEVNQPGLYQVVSVTDGRGCTGPGQGALLVKESDLTFSGVVTNVKCNGASTGAINTTVIGGRSPYNYNWTGPKPIGNIGDPVDLPAGEYKVTVTDFFGCEKNLAFNISEPPPIVPAIVNIVAPNCTNPNGGSIDLNHTGGAPVFTYLWSNGATVQDPQNLAPDTYTVTITDGGTCTKTQSAAVVGDFEAPVASAAVVGQITCLVPQLILDGNGSSTGTNFKYKWTAGPGNIVSGDNTLQPTVNQAGKYTILVTNNTNGCTKTAAVDVESIIAYPTANAGPNLTITCALPKVTLDGTGTSTGAEFSYQWGASPGGNIEGGGNTLNPIVSTPGTYTITVTNNSNGCTTTDNAAVNQNTTNPNAQIASPQVLSCTNKTVALNGSASTPAGSLSYQWTTTNGKIENGQNSATANVSEAGQYTLIVTNTVNGCTDTEIVSVQQDNSVPIANAIAPSGLNCNIKEIVINGSTSTNGPNITFDWSSSTGGGFVKDKNTLTPTVNAPGTYTLLITNTVNKCTASASVLVNQDITNPPAAAGSPATLTCAIKTHEIGDPNASTDPKYQYKWSTSGGNFTTGTNIPAPTVNAPGTYNLVVTNSENGCTTSASVAIAQNIVNPTAVVEPPKQLNCTTPAVQLSGNGSSTGPNFSYEWGSSTGGGIGAGGNTLTPTVTASGTYTITVTNAVNGCTQTASATVTSSTNLPTAIATPSDVLTCKLKEITLSSAGSSSGPSFSYQWGTVDGKIESGNTAPNAQVSLPGEYTLLVSNAANNCTATFKVLVVQDIVPPAADAGNAAVLSCTSPNFTLNGTASSQGANYIYQWTTSGTGNFITPTNILEPKIDQPGIYQLQVTNTQNGCTSTDQVEIKADANDPVVAIAPPAVLNCKNSSKITLNGSGSSTGSNFLYQWTGPNILTGDKTLSPQIGAAGDYKLVITNNNNGCTSEEIVKVDQDIAPPPADAGPDKLLNCYKPQIEIGGSNNPTDPIYTFNWTGAGVLSGANTPTAIVNQGGTYNLLVTNTENGCTATDVVLLNTDFAKPDANAGPGFQLTCLVETYTLQASASNGPQYKYEWTTNTGSFATPTNILQPTVNGAGNYNLTVTNTDNGCTQIANVQITQAADKPISLATNTNKLTCTNQTLSLSGTGSSTGGKFVYEWIASDGGNIVSGQTSLQPLINEPGKYTLSVRDTTNNCVTFSSVTVEKDVATPDIEAKPADILTCAVKEIDLSGQVNSNGNFKYEWQATGGGAIVSGANTLKPKVNATGTYILTVTNQFNGCTSTLAVKVDNDVVPPVSAIAQPDVLTCKEKKIILDGSGSSAGNMKYDWSAGTTVLSDALKPEVSKPGTYTLVVTNNTNGCTSSTSVQVTQDIKAPIAEAGQNGLLTCKISSLELNGDGSSTSTNNQFFYQWTTQGGQILVGANSLKPTIVAGGTYTLNITDNINGCSASDQVFVDVDIKAPLAALVNPAILTCIKPEVTIDGKGSQSGSNIAYVWTTQDGNIVSGNNANAAVVNAAGVYTLIVENKTNGCTSTASATVGSNIVLPEAEAGPPFTLTCSVKEVVLQGVASSGPVYTYKWTTQGGQFITGNSSLQPKVNKEGKYLLLVTNTSTGCTKTDEVEVLRETNVPTGFDVDLDKPSCKDNDGVITFTTVQGGIGPYLYSINEGKTFEPQLSFDKIVPGNYTLLIQDINGCEFEQPLNVPKALDPGIDIIPEIKLQLGDSTSLKATVLAGYPFSLIDTVLWTPMEGLVFKSTDIFGLLTPGVKPLRNIDYKVTIVSTDGCTAEDRVRIKVDNEPFIYIPNVFTPDKSNSGNDKFTIYAKGEQIVQINNFQIFSRWGEMVFQRQNFQPNIPDLGWDGTHNGNPMNPGVFAYYAEIKMIDGRTLLYKGDVTIVR